MNDPLPGATGHKRCCAAAAVREHGVVVGLDVAQRRRICLDGTKYQSCHAPDLPLADALVFVEHDNRRFYVPIELKSGKLDVSTVRIQLQNAANLEGDLGWKPGLPVEFRPTLVRLRKRQDPLVYQLLGDKRNWIRRRTGEMRRIDVKESGVQLSALCN